MSAKKMFKELDYWDYSKTENEIWYGNSDGENAGNGIGFHIKEQYFELIGDFEIIELDLFKAIQQQITELGWESDK